MFLSERQKRAVMINCVRQAPLGEFFMKKISFICCYTKEDLLNDLKKSTACLTDYEIEWVLIDNRNNRFKSAASALNLWI